MIPTVGILHLDLNRCYISRIYVIDVSARDSFNKKGSGAKSLLNSKDGYRSRYAFWSSWSGPHNISSCCVKRGICSEPYGGLRNSGGHSAGYIPVPSPKWCWLFCCMQVATLFNDRYIRFFGVLWDCFTMYSSILVPQRYDLQLTRLHRVC